MSEDRYRALRELPFDVVAGALGIDLTQFKPRKGGTEHAGPCPVHDPKKNSTSFGYASDAGGIASPAPPKAGAIDFVTAVRGIGFQEAVAVLEPYAGNALAEKRKQQTKRPEIKVLQELPTENLPFHSTYEKFTVESAWLKNRGLKPATLDRDGVFKYRNDSASRRTTAR